jgi:hypothetical protein
MFRKSRLGICLLATTLLIARLESRVAASVLESGDNEIFFNDFENLYSSTGVFKPLGSAVVVGDHFMGIINVQNVENAGSTIFFASPTDQLTGIFAQRVEAIVGGPLPPGDPFSGQTTFPHIVLGPPTITLFTGPGGGDVVSTVGLLVGTEMISLWRQSGVGTTPFESNGTTADDVAKATDGAKFLSYSYADPMGDGSASPATADDDTGYWYSHAAGIVPGSGFVGETFLGLNLVFNGSGFTFGKINDVNETEVGDLPPGKLNDVVGTGEIEINPGFLAGTSPWAFRSNDPVTVQVVPIPEPMSVFVWAFLIGISTFIVKTYRTRT